MSLVRGLRRVMTPRKRAAGNPGWPVHYSDLTMMGTGELSSDQDFRKYLDSVRAFPTIASCMNKLVALATAVPLFEEDRKTGNRLDPRERRFVNARGEWMLDRPNLGEGRNYFLAKSYQQLGLCGNLVHFAAGPAHAPEELYVAEFRRIKWIPNQDNQYPLRAAVYHGARTTQRIDFENLCLTRRPHEDDLIFGSSFVRECEDALELLYLARLYNKSLLRRGGRVGGVFVVKGGLSDAQQDRLIAKMREREGAHNAGRSMLIQAEEGEYLPDGSSPQDLEHATTMSEARLEILNVFGFMPALFATKDVNRSNLREAKASAYEDVIRPFMGLMLEQWNAHPMLETAGVYIRADWEQVEALQPNRLEEAQAEALLLDRRVVTPNESRERLKVGGGKTPWGDEPILPAPAISLGFLPTGIEKNPEAVPPPSSNGNGNGADEPARNGAPRSFDDRERIVRQMMAAALGSEAMQRGVAIAARDLADAAPAPPLSPPRRAHRPAPTLPVLTDEQRLAVRERADRHLAAQGATCACCATGAPATRARLEALARGSFRDRTWVRLHETVGRREAVWYGRLLGYFQDLERGTMEILDERARQIGARAADGPKVPNGWTGAAWFDESEALRALEALFRELGPEDVAAGAAFQQTLFDRLLNAGVELVQFQGLVDLNVDEVRRFLQSQTASRVRLITEGQRRMLRDVVEASVQGNETVDQLAIRLQDLFEFERAVRSHTIARTETIGLFTHGGIVAMSQAGVEEHEWLSSRKENVRPAHVAAHGQIVRVGSDFVNEDPDTGKVSHGRGPGLMDAAWANINCVCGTLPARVFPEEGAA